MADRTAARPCVVDGVTFHCYRTGILRYQWRSEDGRCAVGRNYERSTHYAAVDGTSLKPNFRSIETAMHAAVKRAKETP